MVAVYESFLAFSLSLSLSVVFSSITFLFIIVITITVITITDLHKLKKKFKNKWLTFLLRQYEMVFAVECKIFRWLQKTLAFIASAVIIILMYRCKIQTRCFLISHTHDNKECDEHKKLIKQKNTYQISRFNQSSSRTSPKKSIVKNIYLTHTKWNKMKIKRTKTFLAVAVRCFNSGATVSQHFASIGRNRKKILTTSTT